MKNKNAPTIIFIISMLIVIGISVEVIIMRNLLVSGALAAIIVGAMYTVAAILLIAAACIRKLRVMTWICRIMIVGWLIFAFISSFSSVNEDALIIATIYIIAAILAMVFGELRHNHKPLHDKAKP